MNWTTTLPTQPGWYWHRYYVGDEPTVREVVVSTRTQQCKVRDHDPDAGGSFWTLVSREGGEWAGPLEQP